MAKDPQTVTWGKLPLVARAAFAAGTEPGTSQQALYVKQWEADTTVTVKRFTRSVRAGGTSVDVHVIVVRRKPVEEQTRG